MKSVVLGVCILMSGSFCVAMNRGMTKVQLPDAATIEQRLVLLEHFLEKTQLHTKLGSQELTPLNIAVKVECSLADYQTCMKDNRAVCLAIPGMKPGILEAILKDHPAAIQELKDLKVFE